PRVNRAEVRVRAGLAGRKRKLLIGVQHFGFEALVVADHVMGNVISIRPRDLSPGFHGERWRCKSKVIDLDVDAWRTRGYFVFEWSQCGQSQCDCCCDTKDPITFSHCLLL